MTLNELIAKLERARDTRGGDLTVVIPDGEVYEALASAVVILAYKSTRNRFDYTAAPSADGQEPERLLLLD